MSTLLTLLLTAVAFKFVANSWTPTVPYLTLLDKYMVFSFTALFANIIISFCMSIIDVDQAEDLNYIFTVCSCGVWVLLHVGIIVCTRFKWLTPSWDYVESRMDLEVDDCVFVQKDFVIEGAGEDEIKLTV